MCETVEIHCKLQTLSDVIREQNIQTIDLLKIDVEEAEMAVLDGIEPEDWPKIRRLALEVHDKEGRLSAVHALLASKGFGRTRTSQEYVFQGTDIYSVCADRNSA